jgi:hypothetical protein
MYSTNVGWKTRFLQPKVSFVIEPDFNFLEGNLFSASMRTVTGFVYMFHVTDVGEFSCVDKNLSSEHTIHKGKQTRAPATKPMVLRMI